MLTEKDYCDYETCVALKELGYNEKSNWWFNKVLNEEFDEMQLVHICDNPAHLNYDSWGICPKDFVIRPTLYEVQKWLREEKKIEVVILGENIIGGAYYADVYTEDDLMGIGNPCEKYEDALQDGIKTAIELLKEK